MNSALLLAQATLPRSEFQLERACFSKQLEFIRDPALLKCLFCTRRAAKSFTAGLYMIDTALKYPNSNILFIGLTRESAKGIIWKDILEVLNYKYNLKAVPNLSDLTVTFPNGSVIKCLGIDSDQDEMLKLLGRKYRLVCIDEAAMYTVDMEKLVYGILKPAMADLRGTICLMGTSSNFTRGLFYDITTKVKTDWSLHSWSAFDNPFVAKQWQQELDEIDRDRPLFKETPLFKQWYLNQWVVDTDKLVYKFSLERNLYEKLPELNPKGWNYVLGVDTGWEDDNAFVLTAYHDNDPNLYVVDTYNRPHMTFDAVEKKILEYMNDAKRPPSKIVIDGANKQGVESMRLRTAIPFEYADKLGKVDFIEMLNGDLVQSKIRLLRSSHSLINEMMGLVWKTDGDKIIIPKKEHPALPNHLCDAFLYAWRNGYHYMSTALKIKPKPGSKEYDDHIAQELFNHHVEKLERERRLKENEGLSWSTDANGIAGWNQWGD